MFTTGGTRVKVKAHDIHQKASQLNSTADRQSNEELTTTKNTDIKDENEKGKDLATKANLLKGKAEELYTQAEKLETEAAKGPETNPLKPLETHAGKLKNAAGSSTSGGESLYEAANALATGGGIELEGKAEKVITKFDILKGHYDKLMEAAKGIQKETDPLVTAVKDEYNKLKTDYDGMLNLTKLIKKANTLTGTADSQSSTELTTLGQKPTQLASKAEALSDAAKLIVDDQLRALAGNLAQAAKKDGGSDPDNSLHAKATALATTPDQYENAKALIISFDTVKENYEGLITAAIQHGKLSLVQNVISKCKDLKNHYDGMMNITKIRYYSEQIATRAGNLRTTGSTSEPDKIVIYFESMEHAYSSLPDGAHKNKVQDQFWALKGAYDHIRIRYPRILQNSAGETSSQGTLRQLADELYKKANALHTAVKEVSQAAAAKVLRHKAGDDSKIENPKYLRKLAADLHTHATSLATNAKGDTATADDALKQKAGADQNTKGTLRYLAKDLYDKANELAQAVSGGDSGAAQQLADAVGATETGAGIRQKLQLLHEQGTNKAQAVRDGYEGGGTGGGVKPKFEAVQQKASSAYTGPEKQAKYQAVKKAWEAFKDLYDTDLKQLAQNLKEAVGGTDAGGKLQQALQELGDHPATESGPGLTSKAQAVTTAYERSGTSGVKPKFDELKKFETSYQAIASIRPLYEEVVSAMTAFDNVYKPEELLATAVGAADDSGLRGALKDLNDNGSTATELPGLATAVKKIFAEGWSDTVKGKFHLVQAQAGAYKQGDTIKTSEYTQLLQAWTKFNDKYYGSISSDKFHITVIPSIICRC